MLVFNPSCSPHQRENIHHDVLAVWLNLRSRLQAEDISRSALRAIPNDATIKATVLPKQRNDTIRFAVRANWNPGTGLIFHKTPPLCNTYVFRIA
jgi:hypothetical protein